jgi:hypothetical protein
MFKHRGKPLVLIWGLGFPDRPYTTRKIGIDKLIDFLKNDPNRGGLTVSLGTPTHWRDGMGDAGLASQTPSGCGRSGLTDEQHKDGKNAPQVAELTRLMKAIIDAPSTRPHFIPKPNTP